MLDTIWQDVRYAVRSLCRTPGFTVAAAAALALGIGANAAMFSMADATALRPPDVPRPGELVRVFSSTKSVPYGEMSYPDFLDFRARATKVSGLAGHEVLTFALAKDRRESARFVGGWAVTGNFFSALEIEPGLGRGLRADDERAGAQVAVISHLLWQREFGGRSDTVGSRVLLSGAEFTIVGITPEAFRGTQLFFHPDIYIPLTTIRVVLPALRADVLEDRSAALLEVVGRVRDDSSVAQAASEVATIARALEETYPATNRGRTALALPELTARARLDSGGADGAYVTLALVGMILLLACANVANLVLSRSATRMREIGLRAAVGATRSRLVRQLLTESFLLALAGGLAGLLVASWTLVFLAKVVVIPSALPLFVDFRLDTRVLLFTAFSSLLTGMLCGLTPALQSTRTGLTGQLKSIGGATGTRRLTLRSGLVAVQVAISVVVLVAAGLMVRAFWVARGVDPGFRTDGVLLVSSDPGMAQYDVARARRFYDQLVERTRALPGVRAAGLTRYTPLEGISGSVPLIVDGGRMPSGEDRIEVNESAVDGGYWDVLRTPIIEGRAFNDRDTAVSPRVAIVNETFARRYWPGQNAIGRTVRIPNVPGPDGPQPFVMEVVGVARDGKYVQLSEASRPFLYRPFAQGRRTAMTMVVLTDGDPAALAPQVRATAAGLDPVVPIFGVRTLDDLYEGRALLPARAMSQIVTALALLALLLASVGLYGVMAFLAERRTREIGIRVAIGAAPSGVLLMVLRQAAALVVPGLALGVVASLLLTPLLRAEAFDFISPRDPLVLAIVPIVVAAVALLASAIPAIRAARIDPATAVRID
jgi:macrolide transport system ATP-binding/permease protein